MSDFSFSDLNKVHWLATLKLAVARGFASGLVFTILPLIGVPGKSAWFLPFAFAILSLPYALFLQFTGKLIGMFIPLMGVFVQFIGSLIVCLGDPIVYLINRQWPQLFNIADLKFFNLRPLIFITDPD